MNKRSSLPQAKPAKVKVVKGTVLFPPTLHRRIARDAARERRSFSAQVLALVEKGIEAAA